MTVEDIKNYLKEKERILHNEYIESLGIDCSWGFIFTHLSSLSLKGQQRRNDQ